MRSPIPLLATTTSTLISLSSPKYIQSQSQNPNKSPRSCPCPGQALGELALHLVGQVVLQPTAEQSSACKRGQEELMPISLEKPPKEHGFYIVAVTLAPYCSPSYVALACLAIEGTFMRLLRMVAPVARAQRLCRIYCNLARSVGVGQTLMAHGLWCVQLRIKGLKQGA